MNYNISGKNIKDPLVKLILKELNKVFGKLGINFYLIGATARDIYIDLYKLQDTKRATRDLDIAVAVSDWNKYNTIARELLNISDFKKDKTQKQRFIYKDDFPIDIVPFGDIKKKDDKIYWPPDESVAMSVIGFDDVEKSTIQFRFDNDLEVNMATLSGIFMLKLFAWEERHTISNKDADDMAFILTNYLGIYELRAVKDHYNEIYLSDNFTQNIGGAVLLAYDISEIIKTNYKTKSKFLQILEHEYMSEENSSLINQILETHSAFKYEETRLCFEKMISVLKSINYKTH